MPLKRPVNGKWCSKLAFHWPPVTKYNPTMCVQHPCLLRQLSPDSLKSSIVVAELHWSKPQGGGTPSHPSRTASRSCPDHHKMDTAQLDRPPWRGQGQHRASTGRLATTPPWLATNCRDPGPPPFLNWTLSHPRSRRPGNARVSIRPLRQQEYSPQCPTQPTSLTPATSSEPSCYGGFVCLSLSLHGPVGAVAL